jgi:hypothetical protein
MSSLPDEQSPSLPPRIPLGRLLVGRGLLTEEQLIEALLEQDRTGDRLGKVLIRLGFVDAPSVAMALASQHGGPLKTEYGFATGFGPGPTEPAMEPPLNLIPDPAASEPLPSDLRLTDKADVMADGSPSSETDATIPAPAVTADGIARTPSETAPSHSQDDTAFGDLQTLPAEHDPPIQIGTMIAEPDAARAELDAAHARIAELERELLAAREQLVERGSRTAELEDKVAGARLAAETAIAALRGVTEAPL